MNSTPAAIPGRSQDEITEIWLAKMVISNPVEKPVWDINQLADVVNGLQQKVMSLQGNA